MDIFYSDDRVILLSEPPEIEKQLRVLTQKVNYSPKVWEDAYLAAFAMASGRRLVTFDKGFRAYAGLDVEILGGGARG
jgi:predicted nucleic acid-binding protein